MQFLRDNQYQTVNSEVFEAIATLLRNRLPDAVIEHIGSSSVAGLVSKGDLDLYVGVNREVFDSAISTIETLGFNIKQGTLRTDSLCPFESDEYEIEVGLQLVVNGSEFEFFRTFRDLLIANEQLRTEYNRLKFACEGMTPDAYRKVKSKFIEETLHQEREV